MDKIAITRKYLKEAQDEDGEPSNIAAHIQDLREALGPRTVNVLGGALGGGLLGSLLSAISGKGIPLGLITGGLGGGALGYSLPIDFTKNVGQWKGDPGTKVPLGASKAKQRAWARAYRGENPEKYRERDVPPFLTNMLYETLMPFFQLTGSKPTTSYPD